MNYVDMDGVENVAVGLIKQARKDYIKGAKILLLKMKRIPSLNECYKVSYGQAIRQMCDSWRFVIDDPYSIFSDIGEESIIKDWQNSAMMDIYRDLYLSGAVIILNNKPAGKGINDVSDKDLKQWITNPIVLEDFLRAKDYISTLSNGKELLGEWNKSAYNNAYKKSNRGQKSHIQDTELFKEKVRRKKENTKKAKELYSKGVSRKEIADHLGVTLDCIHKYLRSE